MESPCGQELSSVLTGCPPCARHGEGQTPASEGPRVCGMLGAITQGEADRWGRAKQASCRGGAGGVGPGEAALSTGNPFGRLPASRPQNHTAMIPRRMLEIPVCSAAARLWGGHDQNGRRPHVGHRGRATAHPGGETGAVQAAGGFDCTGDQSDSVPSAT